MRLESDSYDNVGHTRVYTLLSKWVVGYGHTPSQAGSGSLRAISGGATH